MGREGAEEDDPGVRRPALSLVGAASSEAKMSDAAFPDRIRRASVQEDFRNGRQARFALYGRLPRVQTPRALQYGRPGLVKACGGRAPIRLLPSPLIRGGFTLVELLVVVAIIGILAAILFPVFASAQQSGRAAKCAQQLRQLVAANLAYADDNSGHFVVAAPDIFGANLRRWHGVRATSDSEFDPSKGPLWPYLGRSGGIRKCPLLTMLKTKSQARAAYESGCGGFGYNYLYVGGTYYRNDPVKAARETSTIGDLASASRTVMFTDAAMAVADQQGVVLIEESFAYPPYLPDSSGGAGVALLSPSVHFRHGGRANVGWCDGHVSAQRMSFTRDGENAYGVDSVSHNLGWFGPRDNSLWDNK